MSYRGSDSVAGEFLSNIPQQILLDTIRRRGLASPTSISRSPVGRDAWLYKVEYPRGRPSGEPPPLTHLPGSQPGTPTDQLQRLLSVGGWGKGLYVEPNYIVRGQEVMAPRRPVIDVRRATHLEWWIRNDAQVIDGLIGTKGADIDALEAWAITTGSRNVAVGILDSGIDVEHRDLAANVWKSQRDFQINLGEFSLNCGIGIRGINCLDLAATPFDASDAHSHGTRLAGIVGGIHGNGRASVGVNSQVTLIPIKVLNWQLYGTIASVVNGLECALQIAAAGLPESMRMTVLLASWGYHNCQPSMSLQNMLDRLLRKNMLVVCAAHNRIPDEYGNLDGCGYWLPAFPHPNLLTVTASDHRDQLVAGYGPASIDLCAPGYAINSPTPGDRCSEANGASMAAAFAAGVAALVQSRCPHITAEDLRQCLIAGATPVSTPEVQTASGRRLNALGALKHSPCAANWVLNNPPYSAPGDAVAPQQKIPLMSGPIDPTTLYWEVEQTIDEYKDHPYPKQKSGKHGAVVTLAKNCDNTYRLDFKDWETGIACFDSCSALKFELMNDGQPWKQADFSPAQKTTADYRGLVDTIVHGGYRYYMAKKGQKLTLKEEVGDGGDKTDETEVQALFVPIVIPQGPNQYSTNFALVLVNIKEPYPNIDPLGMQGGDIHGSGTIPPKP
jgi:hypothetical protein